MRPRHDLTSNAPDHGERSTVIALDETEALRLDAIAKSELEEAGEEFIPPEELAPEESP